MNKFKQYKNKLSRSIRINKYTIYILDKFGLDYLVELYLTLKRFVEKVKNDN